MASKVAFTKKEIANEEKTLAESQDMLVQYQNLAEIAGEDNPDMLTTKRDIESQIAASTARLNELRARLQIEEAAVAPPEPPKWSREAHPILGKLMKPREPEKPISYSVGDVVEAKWTDKHFYKAKITMVTGSNDNPKYLVRFADYPDTVTVDRWAVRPLADHSYDKKRKAESVLQPAATVTSPTTAVTTVTKLNTGKDGTEEAPPGKKFRKIASNKKLQANKNAWQAFQQKGPKIVKKESMFRTGNNPGARVGFTGSGGGMRKDVTRMRNVYKPNHDDDDTLG
jgi:survival-of-motor-neuron-related-splicing factor 30